MSESRSDDSAETQYVSSSSKSSEDAAEMDKVLAASDDSDMIVIDAASLRSADDDDEAGNKERQITASELSPSSLNPTAQATIQTLDGIIEKYLTSIDESFLANHNLAGRRRRIGGILLFALVSLILAALTYCASILIVGIHNDWKNLGIILAFVVTWGVGTWFATSETELHLRVMISYYKNLIERDYSDISSVSTFADAILENPERARQWWWMQTTYATLKEQLMRGADNTKRHETLNSSIIEKRKEYWQCSQATKLPDSKKKAQEFVVMYFSTASDYVDDPYIACHKANTKDYPVMKQALLFIFHRARSVKQYERPFSKMTEDNMRIKLK